MTEIERRRTRSWRDVAANGRNIDADVDMGVDTQLQTTTPRTKTRSGPSSSARRTSTKKKITKRNHLNKHNTKRTLVDKIFRRKTNDPRDNSQLNETEALDINDQAENPIETESHAWTTEEDDDFFQSLRNGTDHRRSRHRPTVETIGRKRPRTAIEIDGLGQDIQERPRPHIVVDRRPSGGYRRDMRLEHDDIADKLDAITLRIQGKLSDPPSGRVQSATDWGEAGAWIENMVNYVRSVHPLLAHYVAMKEDGVFSVHESKLGRHPEIEEFLYSTYERAVQTDGGHLRTMMMKERTRASKAGEYPDIRVVLQEIRKRCISGSDRDITQLKDALNSLRIRPHQDATPILYQYDHLAIELSKRDYDYSDQEQRIHLKNMVAGNNDFTSVVQVFNTMVDLRDTSINADTLRKLIEDRNLEVQDALRRRRRVGDIASTVSAIANEEHRQTPSKGTPRQGPGRHSAQVKSKKQCQFFNRGECRYGADGKTPAPGFTGVCFYAHDRAKKREYLKNNKDNK